jgi:hypothetical protein
MESRHAHLLFLHVLILVTLAWAGLCTEVVIPQVRPNKGLH